MEEGDSPPPEDASQDKHQAQPEQQQLHLESGVVSLPSLQDKNQSPPQSSLTDPFDDWERAPPSKRKKPSNSPSPSPSQQVDKDHAEEMSDDNDSDSEDEEDKVNSNDNKAKPISSKDSASAKIYSTHDRNLSQKSQRRKTDRKYQHDIAKVPRRAEFPVVVRDIRGGSATLQGLGPSKREKAISNHIGPFQWTMGFRREGQFMVACRDKNQQTKLANTTSLILGPGVKIYVECSIPSPHTEGVIKGIPLDENISREDIKVLINGNEKSGLVTDVQRLKRRDGQLSKALRLKFATENLPEEVIICRSLYRVTAYVANPIRCSKCNSFGHHRNLCKEEDQTCPRCGSTGHDARSCNGLKYCKNCKVEGHSAAYSGCPFYKQLKKANQIRATTWMPHHEAFKRAGDSYTDQESSNAKDDYLGAKLSLQTYSQAVNQSKKQDLKKSTHKTKSTTPQIKSTDAKAKQRLQFGHETPETNNNRDENPIRAPPKVTDSGNINENSNTSDIESILEISGSHEKEEKEVNKENKKDSSNSSENKTDRAMSEILKRLDDMAKRQEKQEKETASLRDSFEQERARRIEAEKKFTTLNIKALQQQQKDSRKTSALKEIFSFILQSMNSGKPGSALAGNLDSILSKYMIDDGHQAFIGNQLKAAGEFIARKDSLSEENIFSLTEFLQKK